MEWFCYVVVTKTSPVSVYSGASNTPFKRLQEHNGELPNRGTFTRRFGANNVALALLVGPMPRAAALSIERRLKNTIIKGGGLRGRCRALVRLLSLPGYITKTTRLSVDELRALRVQTSLSREQFVAYTHGDHAWLAQRAFVFDVSFGVQ